MVFGKVHSFSRDLQSTIPLHYNVDDLWLAGQIYIYIHVQKIFMSTYMDTSFLFKINPNTVDMDFRGLKMASNFKNRSLKRLKCEHDGTGVMTDTEWRNGCWSYSPGSACRWYLGLCAFSICTCTTLESRILWPVYEFQPKVRNHDGMANQPALKVSDFEKLFQLVHHYSIAIQIQAMSLGHWK